MNRISRNLLWVLALAAALAVVYRAEVFGGSTFAGGDITFLNYPRMAFVRERLIAGEVPLWAPHIYMGYPLAAEGQAGIFYPPNLILTCVPKEFMPDAVVLLNLFIGALGMFIFLRLLGVSERGSVLAGLAYSANGFMMVHSQHIDIICAMAWAPLLLSLTEIGLRSAGRGALFGIFAGAAAAMMFLAGHPQFAMFGYLAAGVFLVFRASAHRAPFARIAAFSAPAVLTAVLLSLPQLLPLIELSGYSVRPGRLTFDAFTSGSLPPKMFTTLMFPHFQGAAWDATFRAGGAPDEIFFSPGFPVLALSAAALAARRSRRAAAPLALFAIAAFLWAPGGFSPISKVLYHIPVLNMFRVPARAMFFLVFACSALAGMGFDALAGAQGQSGTAPKKSIFSLAVLLSACGSAAGSGALMLLKPRAVEAIVSRISSSAHPHTYYVEKTNILINMMARDFAIAAAAMILIWMMIERRRKYAKPASWAVLALVLFDLASSASSFTNPAPRDTLLYVPHTARAIQSHAATDGFTRIYASPPHRYLEKTREAHSIRRAPENIKRDMDTLDLELSLLYGINGINGYGSLSLWDFQTLVQRRRFASLFEDRSRQIPFSDAEKNAGDLDPVRDGSILKIIKVNRVVRPNAAGDSMEVIDLKPGKSGFSPFWAMCDSEEAENGSPSLTFFDPALPNAEHVYTPVGFGWSRPAAGKISVRIEMPCDGVLLLMEKYYPGWLVSEVTPGGKRGVISGEMFLGIAAPVDKGAHNMEYEFKPEMVDTGITGALASLAAIFVFVAAAFVRGAPGSKRRKDEK